MDKMSSAESEDFPASTGRPGGQTSPLPPRPAPAGPHEGAPPAPAAFPRPDSLVSLSLLPAHETPLSSLPGDPLSHAAGGREKQGLLG